MRRALHLAARGWGRVSPNPMVGAVVVHDGHIAGEGWHEEYGAPHAEVNALRMAGARARGATLYVTLEPCNHHGRTPPCTDAILEAGVRRVVYGAADPNATARGGAQRLADAGVEIHGGVGARASRHLNAAFFHAHERGTPWLALKLAQSIDGAIAAAPGVRTQLSGPRAQAETQRLRAGFDAILVGSGTVRADDPLLTVRGAIQPRVPPLRVILATDARIPPEACLLQTLDQAPLHVIHAHADPARIAQLNGAGVQTHAVPAGDGGVALRPALGALHECGVHSILCEGGAALGSALAASDLLERIYLFTSPRVLGPHAVRGLAAPLPGPYRLVETRRLGDDALAVWDRQRQAGKGVA